MRSARIIDLGARGGKRLERVPDAIMDEVMAKVMPLFEIALYFWSRTIGATGMS